MCTSEEFQVKVHIYYKDKDKNVKIRTFLAIFLKYNFYSKILVKKFNFCFLHFLCRIYRKAHKRLAKLLLKMPNISEWPLHLIQKNVFFRLKTWQFDCYQVTKVLNYPPSI